MNTQQLWQSQGADAPHISLAFVRYQLDTMRRRTRMHDAIWLSVAFSGVAYFAWTCTEMFNRRPLLSTATALWIAATLVCMFRHYKRIASEEKPGDFGVLDALQFHRRQLERQLHWHESGHWLLLLFIPGHVMLFASCFLEVNPTPWKYMIFTAALILLGTWFALVMAERKACSLQKEIDALDSLQEAPPAH